eukprot:TRINITY_DN3716_c0_g1_i1.p1 TRINITY_DN3716_c0_g1~~TRINITY_DN3716_c0_g1_i1.p1  ORF type:complete len:110 (+),score=22.71 TRINITY_DN3716_c0_g1_i1:314-643(+)
MKQLQAICSTVLGSYALLQYIIVKLGSNGVLVAAMPNDSDQESFHYFPALRAPSRVINVTGCGDSFLGAFVAALCKDYSVLEAIPFGLSAANLSLSSENAVNERLSHIH